MSPTSRMTCPVACLGHPKVDAVCRATLSATVRQTGQPAGEEITNHFPLTRGRRDPANTTTCIEGWL